ncbi:Exc2 family lipoprotein [Escherichia coli]|uniref:Exc2 family lipoprotein n=1 Tax=Escherichia coli TaxID=562 RepID=UPI001CBE8AB7|nr:Exc2 family lipoprotein [Escherichia coli]MCD9134353.1 Exc2 family lipoprotein [Escherichia coli]
MSIRPLTTITLILPLLLAACSGSQTSVERNASRAVLAIDRIHFDPNTRMLKADSINSLKPMMQQLYDQGKKDRADGLTLAQAQQRVESFSNPEVLSGGQKARFLSQEHDTDNPDKQRQILLDAGISSYWDGYNGRP